MSTIDYDVERNNVRSKARNWIDFESVTISQSKQPWLPLKTGNHYAIAAKSTDFLFRPEFD